MLMTKRFLSLAAVVSFAAVMLLSPAAHAAEKTGFYIAPKFSMNIQHTERNSQSYYSASAKFKLDTTKTTAGYTVAVGYDFAPKFNLPIRAEIEYGYYGNISKKISSSFNDYNNYYNNHGQNYDIGIKTLLVNLYGDLGTWNGFTPYVGAGIGVAFVNTQCELTYPDGTDSDWNAIHDRTHKVLAGQVGFGCSYAFNDTVSLDLGYRLLMLGKCDSMQFRPGYGVYGAGSANYPCRITENGNTYIQQFMLGLRVTF